jgi:hypothetical protein
LFRISSLWQEEDCISVRQYLSTPFSVSLSLSVALFL